MSFSVLHYIHDLVNYCGTKATGQVHVKARSFLLGNVTTGIASYLSS